MHSFLDSGRRAHARTVVVGAMIAPALLTAGAAAQLEATPNDDELLALREATTLGPAPILGDVTGDCVVNVLDLTAVLAAFGSDDPDADVNQDNVVDASDSEIVLGLWGWTCGQRLIGDVNGDGLVSSIDLAAVLGAWNGRQPQTDINDDGVTNDVDLQMVLANWGDTLGRRLLGDVNGDDVVNARDLAIVLANGSGSQGTIVPGGPAGAGIVTVDVVLARWGATSGTDLPGDVNGDRVVDGADQSIILATWGPAPARFDLDGDGQVGSTDLVIVLGNWGRIAGDDLPGDVNGDWVVDGVDSDLIQAVWGTGWAPADLDGSGAVGTTDLTMVLGNWHDTFALSVPGDVDGSCRVDGADQDLVLAFWGTSFRPADVNGDGTVGVVDLTIVLGNFGNECR